MKNIFFISAILVCSIVACTPKVDLEAAKLLVSELIQKHLVANENENLEDYLHCWSDESDMVNIGSSGEYWIGKEDLREHAIQTWELFEDADFASRKKVINIGASGKIAWVSCYFDVTATLFGETVSIEGMRFSAVLEKQNDNCVYVHTHASIPSTTE